MSWQRYLCHVADGAENCASTDILDSQKAKVGIKVVESRKRRAIAEAGLKASEGKQRQGINQELGW